MTPSSTDDEREPAADEDSRATHPSHASSDDAADSAIRAIAKGADPATEAFALSNRFTDDATARVAKALRAFFRRSPR